ncbi:bifunctional riboflavin kinase/FAD synthetase [Erysipelotrichaceae bacterium]|nr:bifunctional riboflavin kinase/FAD synthetase [Erysipelotrichaceae bacterium]
MEQLEITEDFFEKTGAIITTNLIAVLGYFDGIHHGHEQLVKKAQELKLSRKEKIAAIVFEFPNDIQRMKKHQFRLMTLEDKKTYFEDAGFDYFIVVELTTEIMKQTPEFFIKKLANRIALTAVVVGFDYRFGSGGSGDVELLEKLGVIHGFQTYIIPEQMDANLEKNSSSIIREAIENGEIEKANRQLVKQYFLRGIVVPGMQKGRLLGFPTANIADAGNYIMPQNGVYIVEIILGEKKHHGICNIGFAPTIKLDNIKVVETNIFDFNEDIYGKEIIVIFLKRLRSEMKFSGIDQLKSQISTDVATAKDFFEKSL